MLVSMPVAFKSLLSAVEMDKDCSFVATFEVNFEYTTLEF